MVSNVGVYAVRKLKDKKKKHPTRAKLQIFLRNFVLQVGEKSVILRFKAKDEALSSTLNSDGHKHFVRDRYFYQFIF
jgi:hypothetical protein